MKAGEQQCNTSSGHVRKHVTALEAATAWKDANSPTSPAEVLRRVSRCHGTPARPAHCPDNLLLCMQAEERRTCDLCLQTSHRKSPALRQSTGSLQAGHLAGRHNTEATHDEVSRQPEGVAPVACVICSLR